MSTPDAPATALDVFVSYAREDRATAARLAEVLHARAIGVWWDREILGGTEFSAVIEHELTRARVVLVLWSNHAVRSPFVRDESARAFAAGKLLPVRIEDVPPPLGFGQIHTLDLLDWDGDGDAPALAELVAHIERRLKGGAGPLLADAPLSRAGPIKRRTLFAGGAAVVAAGAAWFGWSLLAPDTQRAQQLTAEGVENFEKKEFGQARLRFNQALVADSDYAPALFYRAQVLVQSGAPEEAGADLKRVLELKRGLDDAQLRDARHWFAELAPPAAEPTPVARVAAAERPEAAIPPPPSAPPPSATHAPPTGARPTPVTPARPSPGGTEPSSPSAAGADGTVVGLHSVALAGPAFDKLNATVGQMFSPVKDARLAATTSLIVDPELTSDAVPIGVRRALQAQRNGVPNDPAELSGVINVFVLMQSATPSTLALHAAEIGRLLNAAKDNGRQTMALVTSVSAALARAVQQRPLVYLQIASEAQRGIANALAARLRTAGYRVPAAEIVAARAPVGTEIRAHGRSDKSLARWMAKATQETSGAPVELRTLRNAKPNEDTFEIWFDAALCIAPDRKPAACGA